MVFWSSPKPPYNVVKQSVDQYVGRAANLRPYVHIKRHPANKPSPSLCPPERLIVPASDQHLRVPLCHQHRQPPGQHAPQPLLRAALPPRVPQLGQHL
jgi:hypothetical protein